MQQAAPFYSLRIMKANGTLMWSALYSAYEDDCPLLSHFKVMTCLILRVIFLKYPRSSSFVSDNLRNCKLYKHEGVRCHGF
jgi:hypothetical protein